MLVLTIVRSSLAIVSYISVSVGGLVLTEGVGVSRSVGVTIAFDCVIDR